MNLSEDMNSNNYKIESKNTTRLEYVDVLKGFAILCMVTTHISPLNELEKCLASFMIPLFFIMSGYLFNFDKYRDSFSTFIKTRAKRLLLPYFLCFVIFFLYWLFFTFTGPLTEYSINQVFEAFIYQLKGYLYGCGSVDMPYPLKDNIMPIFALWFIPVLFLADIILLFFLKVTNKIHAIFQFILLCLLMLFGKYLGTITFWPWGIDIALVSMIFLWTGYKMKQYDLIETINNFRFKNILLFLLICIWIFSIPFYNYSFNDRIYNNLPLSFLVSTMITIVFFSIAKNYTNILNFKNILSYLGQKSLIILCMHYTLYLNTPENSILRQYFVLEIIYVILASLAIGIVINKIPFLTNIFSRRI